ncbi:MAG: hypothetical protein IKN48_10685 [Bacteroidaceae bacterium]|nr:hypothetical protein [Bacteroidaceae bacterium]
MITTKNIDGKNFIEHDGIIYAPAWRETILQMAVGEEKDFKRTTLPVRRVQSAVHNAEVAHPGRKYTTKAYGLDDGCIVTRIL